MFASLKIPTRKLIQTKKLLLLILTILGSILLYLSTQNTFLPPKIYKFQPDVDFQFPSNRIHQNSWHVPHSHLEQLKVHDPDLPFGSILRFPKLQSPRNISKHFNDYLILVPMSKVENIDFFKNFYSDLNILLFCDQDDNRPDCDINLGKKYVYEALKQKTIDIFKWYCNQPQQYKMVAKMDFDTIADKRHIAKVAKFMADNVDKRLYYGNPFPQPNGIAMGGNFYAMSGLLLSDYCSCETPSLKEKAEDIWYGLTINSCVNSKSYEKKDSIYYMFNDQTKILHKSLRQRGVSLELGTRGNIFRHLW